jgi:ArsR family transcriptional regulator
MARHRSLPLLTSDGLAPLGPALSDAAAVQLARDLAVLADPTRLRLLSLIAERGAVCSCDLERPLERSQPTISHHTKVLSDAGFLLGERRGRWMWWRIHPERQAALAQLLAGAVR